MGVKSETLSVARREYDDLQMMVYDQRISMPKIEILLRELMQLRIINDKKVDHPAGGGKDLADAVAGAVSNAVRYTPRHTDIEIEVMDGHAIRQRMIDEQPKPKEEIPSDISDWLGEIGML